MSEGSYKLFVGIFVVIFLISLYMIFSSDDESYDVDVTTVVTADQGLDLRAVGEILKKAKNAEEFEKLLNSKSEAVNNLDLNDDGKVDYINVAEFADGDARGFSLSTETSKGEKQEIATILIQKKGDKAEVQMHGNEQIYGRNHYYHSPWSGVGTGLMMGYLWGSHSMWRSPYTYGSYPGHYNSWNTYGNNHYRGNVESMVRGSRYERTSNRRYGSEKASPNFGKSSKTVKTPLKSPTQAQSSFQKKNPSRAMKARRSSGGGFGRSGSVRSSSSSSRFGGK